MKLKKILALVLCVAMVLSTMSFTVFAEVKTYNVANDEELADALSNAVAGDTIKLAAGDYTGGISVGKEITVEGSVDEDGNPTTVFSGDKGGNYYSYSIYMNKGTIKNIKIVDAWKGIMTEGKGSLTIDNVTMVEIGYGIHIAEAKNAEDTVTIQNSNIDVTWACSFASGPYALIIKKNVFTSNDPYYTDGTGSPVVNSLVENTTVEDNYFGENAKVAVRADFEVGTNFYEDGVENALHSWSEEDAKVPTYYADREMTEVAITPDGTITIGYTSQTRIWGEGGSNAKESFVVELYAGDEKIAQASLNNYEDIIDGDLYVTWGIPFNGQDSNYWDVEWYGNNPNVNVIPTKVVLVVDGMKVDENEVQLNAPDNLNGVIWNELEGIPAEAKIGNVKYDTLDAAIAAAAGAEITLIADAELNTKLNNATINIDLNGYKMDVNVGSNYIIGENSISNGTIDISNASSSQNIFGLAQYRTPATTLTMDNVNFIGDGFNSGYAVFEIGNSGADVALTVTNSTINLKNDNAAQGGFVKGYGPNCVLTITNTEVTLDNTDMFNVNVAANIADSEFTIANLSDTAFRNLGGTIDNTIISVTNSGNGIRNSNAGYNLAVKNDSSIKISGSTCTEEGKIGDLVLSLGNKVDVDATSELLVETSAIANAEDVTGNVISKADVVYVQYKKVDVDANGKDTVEGSDKYEIVLAGADAEKINELASADLTFNFVGKPVTNGSMNYTVEPANGVSLSQIGDRFMFNYDGVTKYEETGAAIVIGTITIDGYGSYTLGTKNVTTNAVYATEIRNNIVDGFTPAAGLDISDSVIDVEIKVPTRTLTINIDFPNAIEYKDDVAYQDMKVEITGNIGGVNKTVKYDLGELVDGSYVVTDANLVLDNAYTVTVSGAGYRTARYTVTMTENKALRFWNNVMDEAQVVEIGKDSSAVNVTFLAGDIVKDNKINIYDLSAVVSYFGTENLVTEHPEYAKYDLNRDGVIDSKDVAYVLVSWGN